MVLLWDIDGKDVRGFYSYSLIMQCRIPRRILFGFLHAPTGGDVMIPVQVRVTKKLMELLDKLIESGAYSNRSEAIRDSIRKNIDHFHANGFLKKILDNTDQDE